MSDSLDKSIAAARFNLEAAEVQIAAGDAAAAVYPALIALELAVDSAAEAAQVTAPTDPGASPHKRTRARASGLEAQGIAPQGTERLLGRLDYARTSGYRGEAPGFEALELARRALSVTSELITWLDPDHTLGELDIDAAAAVEAARLAHEREIEAREAKDALEVRREAEAVEEAARRTEALATAAERAEATIATFLSVALPAGCPGLKPVRMVDSEGRRFRTVRAWVFESPEHVVVLRPEGDVRRLWPAPEDEDEDEDDDLFDAKTGEYRGPSSEPHPEGISRTLPPLQGEALGQVARTLVRGIADVVAREGLRWPEETVEPPPARPPQPIVPGGPGGAARAVLALLGGFLPLLAATTEPSLGLLGLLVLGHAIAGGLRGVGDWSGAMSVVAAPLAAGLGMAAAHGDSLFLAAAAAHAVLGVADAVYAAVSGPWDRWVAWVGGALMGFWIVGGSIAWLALLLGWIGLI